MALSALALLLCVASALPAWLVAAGIVVQAYRHDVSQGHVQVLAVARTIGKHLAAGPPGPDSAAAARTLTEALSGLPGWTGAVIDRRGEPVAVTTGFEQTLPDPSGVIARAHGHPAADGVQAERLASGAPVIVAYSRSAAGAAVVVVPERLLKAGADDAIAGRIATMALALLASGAMAAGLLLGFRRRDAQLLASLAGHLTTTRLLDLRTRERDAALLDKAELVHEMRRDPLTRLANRTEFLRHLDACIGRHALRGGHATVFFIDVDDFKAVNDRWGHAVGDELLCAFAKRLIASVRHADLSARWSGDEFTVLIDGLTPLECEPIAQSLLDRLSEPFRLGASSLRVSASIGMAAYPADGADAASLMKAADGAMYAVKSLGKGDFRRSGWGDLPRAEPAARTNPHASAPA